MNAPALRHSPSGEQVELQAGRQQLVVVSGGAGIRSYAVGARQLLDGYAEDEVVTGGRGQLLIPWPNRIRDGRYRFGGAEHQLDLTEPALHNAIHGLTRGHTWTVAERSAGHVGFDHMMVAQPGYPWVLRLRVEYTLGGAGLTVRTTVTNLSDTAAPYAQGAHPYLRVGDGEVDTWLLEVHATTRLLTDEQQIPVGEEDVEGTAFDFREAHAIGAMKLDTAYAGLHRGADGRARVVVTDPQTGVNATLWMDRTHEYVMVFTGDTLTERRRHGVGVEPMTCPPNAFATGDHLVVLQPGQTHSGEWGISPGGVEL